MCRIAILFLLPPLSNDTIDSVLRHREGSRAKDLSAPIVILFAEALRL